MLDTGPDCNLVAQGRSYTASVTWIMCMHRLQGVGNVLLRDLKFHCSGFVRYALGHMSY